ncbi:MAG: DUF1109 domain-containing protein [Alphaproteobacteria bacterium]
METDDLIAQLSENLAPARPHAVMRQLGAGLLLGLVAAAILLQATLHFRHNLAAVLMVPGFWMKLSYTVALAALGLWIVERQSRAAADASKPFWLLGAPLVALAGLAAWQLSGPGADTRYLMMGQTAKVCSTFILILSLPIFAGIFWAVRQLAPTRLTLAGASAGLLSGATSAALYCFHCPETAAPFILIWYTLGILLTTALGALLGRWILRW